MFLRVLTLKLASISGPMLLLFCESLIWYPNKIMPKDKHKGNQTYLELLMASINVFENISTREDLLYDSHFAGKFLPLV